jgi:hypothetical protein
MMHPLSWLEEVTCAPLSDRAVRLANVLCLVFRNRDTGLICPTRQTMADRLGCSIDTVKRAVAELSKAGWIVVVPGRWRGAPSSYQLSTPSGNVVALSTPKGGQTSAKTPSRDRDGGQETRERGAEVHPFDRKPTARKGGRCAPERGADMHPPYRTMVLTTRRALDHFRDRRLCGSPFTGPTLVADSDRRSVYAWTEWLAKHGLGKLVSYPIRLEDEKTGSVTWALPARRPPDDPRHEAEAVAYFQDLRALDDEPPENMEAIA